MPRSKNKIFIFALMLTIFISSAFLFACNKNKNDSVIVEAGVNGSVEKINEDNTEFYLASPDDWYLFVGWFDGNRKYSENPKLKITQNTPKKLEARFATTAVLSFDRILNSLYNSYKSGVNKEGDYFNFLGEGVFEFEESQIDVTLGGYLNFTGNGNQIYLKGEGNSNFSYTYNDNLENGYIYLENNDEKIAFCDLGLLSNILTSLPQPSQNNWTLETVLNNKQLYYQIDQYFGYLNAFGLVSDVINLLNKTELTISFNKLLALLKNFSSMFENGSLGKGVVDALTGYYTDENFPKITINIKVDYKGDDYQEIDKIEIDCLLEKDYRLNIGEEGIVIPQGNINFKINNLKYGFSDKAEKVEDEKLNSYPVSEQKMINAHIDGNLVFIAEGETDEVIDNYKVEFDADLNPFALLAFKGEEKGFYDIEWEKLGFLSFRVVLDPFEDETLAVEQYARHKGSTDYINILIDTNKFGAKVFVYAACYNPATLFSSRYLINNSYDLPALLSFNSSKTGIELQSEAGSLNTISSLLKSLLNLSFNFDENNINKSFYEILSNFLSNEFNTNINLEENKISVNVQSIRNIIRGLEKNNGLTLAGNPIKTDKYFFGEDKISKLELSFNNYSKGSVVKDIDGNYLDVNGRDIVKEFNNKHNLVVEITEIEGIENLNLEEISLLKGTSVQATELLLSDGTRSDKYIDCDGNLENLSLNIQNVVVDEGVDGKIEVKLILFVNSPTHTIFTLTNSISNILYEYFSLPLGLLEYSFYVDIN